MHIYQTLKKVKIQLILILRIAPLIPFSLHASSDFSPTIKVTEYLVSNSTPFFDEDGHITVISPGFKYQHEKSRSQFGVDYSFNIEEHSGLSSQDTENHSLNLLYGYTHVPNHWVSRITGQVKQASISVDGVQSFNPVVQPENTREFRGFGMDTSIIGSIKKSVNYQTSVLADYADFDDADHSESIGFDLQLDNQRTGNKFFWNLGLNSRESMTGASDEKVTTLAASINYQFSHQYIAYLNVQSYDTSNSSLNDTSNLLGFIWQPNRSSLLKIGAGQRGDDTNYSMAANLKRRRLLLSITYDEEITTLRSQALLQVSQPSGLSTTFQVLSIIPVLQKKAAINLSLNGNKTTLSISFFTLTRNQTSINSNEQQTDSISLRVNRKLSRKSSLNASIQQQQIQTLQQNDLSDFSISYNRNLTKSANLTIELRRTEQDSNVEENRYQNELLGIVLNNSF